VLQSYKTLAVLYHAVKMTACLDSSVTIISNGNMLLKRKCKI
jgi:hypothetical protein